MNNVEWVPIVMFMGITAVLIAVVWFRHKTKEGMQQTFRSALDKGQELTPEVIDALGQPKRAKDKDLRLGVIWIAIAIGLSAFGFGLPINEDVDVNITRLFMGIASFPFVIGCAYLLLNKIGRRD